MSVQKAASRAYPPSDDLKVFQADVHPEITARIFGRFDIKKSTAKSARTIFKQLSGTTPGNINRDQEIQIIHVSVRLLTMNPGFIVLATALHSYNRKILT